MKSSLSVQSMVGTLNMTKGLAAQGARHELYGIEEPYAALHRIGNSSKYVAITTDGVGTKSWVAARTQRYNTIGIDCVAVNVNDLLCVGAEPFAMTDHISIREAMAFPLQTVAHGLYDGARMAQIIISGGETAELPDILVTDGRVNAFDLSGTAIGFVDEQDILVGQYIEDGDALVAFASSGIHANGISKALRLLEENDINFSSTVGKIKGVGDPSWGHALMEPTAVYVGLVRSLRRELSGIKAFYHSSGGGIYNILRTPWGGRKFGYTVDVLPNPPLIFRELSRMYTEYGENWRSAYEIWNMGMGMFAVMSEGGRRTHTRYLRRMVWNLGVAHRARGQGEHQP